MAVEQRRHVPRLPCPAVGSALTRRVQHPGARRAGYPATVNQPAHIAHDGLTTPRPTSSPPGEASAANRFRVRAPSAAFAASSTTLARLSTPAAASAARSRASTFCTSRRNAWSIFVHAARVRHRPEIVAHQQVEPMPLQYQTQPTAVLLTPQVRQRIGHPYGSRSEIARATAATTASTSVKSSCEVGAPVGNANIAAMVGERGAARAVNCSQRRTVSSSPSTTTAVAVASWRRIMASSPRQA